MGAQTFGQKKLLAAIDKRLMMRKGRDFLLFVVDEQVFQSNPSLVYYDLGVIVTLCGITPSKAKFPSASAPSELISKPGILV